MSSANEALLRKANGVGGFGSLNRTPYVEVGFRINNIFKVLRVDVIHRLTYRDSLNPATGPQSGTPATPFAIKASGWPAF